MVYFEVCAMKTVDPNNYIQCTNDADLWSKLKQGSKQALDTIYYHHASSLVLYGRQFSKNEALVDDCVQELFIDLWMKRDHLGSTNHIRYYLLKSLKRRVLRSIKRLDKQRYFDDVPAALTQKIFSSLNDSVVDGQLKEQLSRSLQKLSKLQREVLYLKYYNNLSCDDIAVITDSGKKKVYNALSKAMITLRKLMIGNP